MAWSHVRLVGSHGKIRVALQRLLLFNERQRHLVSHYLVAPEVFYLSPQLRHNVALVTGIETVFFQQNACKVFYRHVGLVFVPQKQFFEAVATF